MEWISIKKELPKAGFEIIICTKRRQVMSAYYDGEIFEYEYNGIWHKIKDAEFWMPLPEPPK
jgi:hypothetical protein